MTRPRPVAPRYVVVVQSNEQGGARCTLDVSVHGLYHQPRTAEQLADRVNALNGTNGHVVWAKVHELDRRDGLTLIRELHGLQP